MSEAEIRHVLAAWRGEDDDQTDEDVTDEEVTRYVTQIGRCQYTHVC